MDKEIELLCDEIRQHCERLGRYDEELVKLGIALGRLLEQRGVSDFRLPVFEEFDASNAEYERKWAPVKSMSDSLLQIVRAALAEQIQQHGSFCLGQNGSIYHQTQLDEIIARKFNVSILSSCYDRQDSSIVVSVEAMGDLGAILQSAGLQTTFRCVAVDVDEDNKEKVLDRVTSVHDICEVTPILQPYHTALGDHDIEQLRRQIEGQALFAKLQCSAPM